MYIAHNILLNICVHETKTLYASDTVFFHVVCKFQEYKYIHIFVKTRKSIFKRIGLILIIRIIYE